MIQCHKRPREFICLQFLKTVKVHQFLCFLHGNIALLCKFSHCSLHFNWQNFSPVFVWLFLPVTVNTKPFSEQLKSDPLMEKIPLGLLLPAKFCSLAPTLACAVLQQLEHFLRPQDQCTVNLCNCRAGRNP